MQQATYTISGMTCGGCVQAVTRALQQIDGGLEVAVSLERGVATVRGEHDPAAVRAAIEAAGFEVAPAA